MDTKEATAGRVAAAVKAAGITRRDLSDRSGIPYTTLFRKINGYTSFNLEELAAVARVLEVQPSSLVDFGAVA